MNESEYSYDFSQASHIKSVQPQKIQIHDFCQSVDSEQHQQQNPLNRKSNETKELKVDVSPKFENQSQNNVFKQVYHSNTHKSKTEIPIKIEQNPSQIKQRKTASDQILESRIKYNQQNQGIETRKQTVFQNLVKTNELQKTSEFQETSSSQTDHRQKYTDLDQKNDELFDTINTQIKEDFKYMMIVLFPFLLVQIFVVQLANCVDTLINLRQNQDIKMIELKSSNNYIDSLNFYFVLAIMISIHVTYVAFYAVIAYQIYKKSRLFQKFVNVRSNKIYIGNNFDFGEKSEKFKVLSGILCFFVIIFQDTFFYELLIKFNLLNSQNGVYLQNNLMGNLFEKLFYILVCYSFRKHCNCSFWKFMIIYQILLLSKVFRVTGWMAYKDILPEDFWMKDDLSFIKIIFGYQILFTQYRCWVQSLIHKQKIAQNQIQPFETLSNQIKISIIQKFNQKFGKNGFVEQLPDFDFLGSYTKICNPYKNRSKTNAVQQDKISKRMLQKTNSSLQIGLDMYDNLCTCLITMFFQIAENISVPPQKDDLKRTLKEFQLHKDELLLNTDCFEEKFKNDFFLNLQTAITKNKLNHNKFSNIKSFSFQNFLKLHSNQFNDQMIDDQYSLDDFLYDHKNKQKFWNFYQQEQKVLIKIEKIEFDKNLYLLQFEIFQKNDKIQINIHDEDAVQTPSGESLESKRIVRPIEIEIMNRTLSSKQKESINRKKMRNRSHKSHQNIQSFVSPLINKQNIQPNNLSSRLKENDEQQAQRRGFSFGSADYIDYDNAIHDNIRQNQEYKSQKDYQHQSSLLSPNKQVNPKIDYFITENKNKFVKNSSCSDSSVEASSKSGNKQKKLYNKQQTHVSFNDETVQQNDSSCKSGQNSSSEVQEKPKNIKKFQRRKTLERGKSHVVEKNEKHQEMINYIDQSEFDQEAISETNKKKEVKNKLQVKQRKLVRQKTQTIQHKKRCSKKSMADQVLKMMKDEQEKKELQFLKQLEYQIEQQIESNQNTQTIQTSKFKQSQKKLQQYLIKGVNLIPENKPSNNQLQNCQTMDTQMKMQQTFQEQLISLKNIIIQKEQIFKQKHQVQENSELQLSKRSNLKSLINSREIDQKKDKDSKKESHFILNQSILNNKFNAKSQTLKQLIEHYENKVEQKQAALEFFKNKTKNLQQSLDSNKIFLNMAVHDMRNPTNQVEFLVSESLKSLKEIQKLNQEMQQLKIQNQDQIQNPVQIVSMSQIQNQQVQIGEQQERIFRRELIIEEEEKVFKAEDEIQIELRDINQQQNQFRSINNFDQQIQLNLLKQQPLRIPEQQIIQDQQPEFINQENFFVVKQEKIKRVPSKNSIHNKFQKDDKRKNIIKKQQIKAQIFKEKKKQNAQFSIKRKKSEFNFQNSLNSDIDRSDQSNFKILEKSLNSQIIQNQEEKLNFDIKKKKKILEKKLVQNKINQMAVLVQNLQIKEEHINLQRKQFYKNFNQQQKLILNNPLIMNDNKNSIFPHQNSDKKNFVEIIRESLGDFKNNLIYQEERQVNEDFEFNENDQEPYITIDTAQKMHLSHDRYLLLLSQQKVKKYLKCELQKLSRNTGLCNIEVSQFKKKFSQQSQTDEDNTTKEAIGKLQNQNSQLVRYQNLYETQIGQKLQILEKNLENVINKLENCKYCSTMLLNLINDMMDLAKSEKMKFELNCEFFDLTKTIERAFDTLSYFKLQKNITTHFIIDKNIEPFFQNFKGDENRFSQILLNFLSNAFKFTSQNGTIWMQVCKNGDQEFCQKIFPSKDLVQQNQNVLELLDQPQINLNNQIHSEVAQDQIQESQSKLDEYYISFQVRIKDSGMGIAKENLGKLFLNFGKLQDTQGCNKQGTGLGLSICKHIIEKMGGKVHVESDGVGTGTTFVIVMQAISKIDISILNNSENQLFFQIDKTKQESSSQKFNNQILIEQKEKILKDQKEALKEAHIFQNIQIEPSVNDTKKDIKSMKVLVINDEFFILQMLIMMVKQTEVTDIDTAQNGFDGFNMVKAKQYDFILCDLNMPVMDGFECIQKIKEHYQDCNSFFERSSNPQIFCPYLVACSAFINSKIEQQAITAGFELIVESPLTYMILKDTIIPNTLDRYKEKQISNILKISNSLRHLNLSQILIEDIEIDSNSSMQIKNLIEQIDEDLQEIQDQNIKMQQQQQSSDSPESDESDSSSQMDDLLSYKNGSSNQILDKPSKQRYSEIKEVDEEQLEDDDYNRQIQIVRKKESVLSILMSQKLSSSDEDNSISAQENSELNSQRSKSGQVGSKSLKKIQYPSIEKAQELQRNRVILSYNPRYQNQSQKSDRSQTDKSSGDFHLIHNPSQGSISQESIMMSIKKPQEVNQVINKRSFFSQLEKDEASDSSSSPLEIKERKILKTINEKTDKAWNNQSQIKQQQLSLQKQSSENKKQFYKQVSFNRQAEDDNENDKISKQMAFNKQLQIRKKPSFAEKVQFANDSFKQNQYKKGI